jgi:excisionase family DNA binding protein
MTNTLPQTGDPLKTKREAALYLNIGTRTLDDWMKRKMVPFFKIGKVVRFRVSDLEAALNKKFLVS